MALATDGSAFYYGKLSVDALDATKNLHVFPEVIYAASGTIAFGNNQYYDAHNVQPVGALGVTTTAFGMNLEGADFWVYDAAGNELRHFVPYSDGGITDAGTVDGDIADSSIADAGTTETGIALGFRHRRRPRQCGRRRSSLVRWVGRLQRGVVG